MTYTERATHAIAHAERTEEHCDGYQWRLAFRLGQAVVYALLAIAVAIEALNRED